MTSLGDSFEELAGHLGCWHALALTAGSFQASLLTEVLKRNK